MEVLTMLCWAMVAVVSLLFGHGVILGRLSLGVGALAGLAGAGLSILYVVLEGPAGLAWGAVGAAAVGFVAVSIAEVGLTSGDGGETTRDAQRLQEHSAGWGGLLLPLFVAVACLSAYTALHGVTSY